MVTLLVYYMYYILGRLSKFNQSNACVFSCFFQLSQGHLEPPCGVGYICQSLNPLDLLKTHNYTEITILTYLRIPPHAYICYHFIWHCVVGNLVLTYFMSQRNWIGNGNSAISALSKDAYNLWG